MLYASYFFSGMAIAISIINILEVTMAQGLAKHRRPTRNNGRYFSKNTGTHKKNIKPRPMRGGIRL